MNYQQILEKAARQTYVPKKSPFDHMYPKQHNETPVGLHARKAQGKK